jgi:hypothetical protein
MLADGVVVRTEFTASGIDASGYSTKLNTHHLFK